MSHAVIVRTPTSQGICAPSGTDVVFGALVISPWEVPDNPLLNVLLHFLGKPLDRGGPSRVGISAMGWESGRKDRTCALLLPSCAPVVWLLDFSETWFLPLPQDPYEAK